MNQIIVITLIVVGVLLLLGVAMMLLTRNKGGTSWQAEVESRILAISKSVDPQNASSLKVAIMEYDKLAELVLKNRGARGNNIGERLKDAKRLFASNDAYQQMWALHKERNRLAHEFDYNPNPSQLLTIVSGFRKSIEQLTRG
jgi:hypothetical protein